eukprot:2369045-Prymnesium_polylepis.1
MIPNSSSVAIVASSIRSGGAALTMSHSAAAVSQMRSAWTGAPGACGVGGADGTGCAGARRGLAHTTWSEQPSTISHTVNATAATPCTCRRSHGQKRSPSRTLPVSTAQSRAIALRAGPMCENIPCLLGRVEIRWLSSVAPASGAATGKMSMGCA